MATFALSGLSAAENQGSANAEAMMRLAQLRAQQAGQGDFLNYILSQNQPTPPTAMNPPPGQPSKPSPTAPGAPAAGAAADAGAAGRDFQQQPGILPQSLQQMVSAIRKNNPGASPQEIMAALETAEPFMDSQAKQQLALYKQQLDFAYKEGSLADRQKRTDAYVKHLKTIEDRGDPKAMVAEGMKIQAGIRQLNARKAQVQQVLTSGTKPDGTPLTADDRKKLGDALTKLNGAINDSMDYYKTFQGVRAGSYGQQFESANPPPEDQDVTTGGDSGGGQ